MSSQERNARFNPTEPEGSYGCCWKYLTPEDPASFRCTLTPGHNGDCACEDDESLVGQTRYNAEATECIKVLGCYGYGSGGFLYAVSVPAYGASSPNSPWPKAPNGMSHADILEAYPSLQCDECRGSGNSCCNGPCHKCNGDLVLRRSRLERV